MSIQLTKKLIKGHNYLNQDLCEIFLCAPQGGMRRSKRTNTLVLIANHTKSIYEDRWDNGVLNYTGMGQSGDQSLEGNQNITLYESGKNNIEVHLFEVLKKKIYTYKGQVELAKKPFKESQDDQNGQTRSVWVFPLRVSLNSSKTSIHSKADEANLNVKENWRDYLKKQLAKTLDIEDEKSHWKEFLKNKLNKLSNEKSDINNNPYKTIKLEDEVETEESNKSIFDTQLSLLNLNPETERCLLAGRRMGFFSKFTIGELIEIPSEKLFTLPNFKTTSLENLQSELYPYYIQTLKSKAFSKNTVSFGKYLKNIEKIESKKPLKTTTLNPKTSEESSKSKAKISDGSSEPKLEISENNLDIKISDLTLSVRSINCLNQELILTIRDLIAISDFELLRIPNLGEKSLNEIKLFLKNGNLELQQVEKYTINHNSINLRRKAFHDIDLSHLQEMFNVPIASLIPMDVRSLNCLNEAKIITLEDLLGVDLDLLMRTPKFGIRSYKDIGQQLSILAKSNNLTEGISYLIDDSSLESYIFSLEPHLRENEFTILKARVGIDEKPKTLEETGIILNVTRERIRQVQSKLGKKHLLMDLISLINNKLLEIRKNLIIPLYVEQISIHDKWFELLNTKPWILNELLEIDKTSNHNVEKIDGQLIVTYGEKYMLNNFINYLKRHLGEQVGNVFSKNDLRNQINLLIPGMANEISSFLLTKLDGFSFTDNVDESKSMLVSSGIGVIPKLIAKLESSDLPLTKDEIFKGITNNSHGSQRALLGELTKINAKQKGVFLFGRSLYGLRRHCPIDDDEMDFIIEKINYHLVDSNPDKQWHCNEILKNVIFFDSIKDRLNIYTLAICLKLSHEYLYLGQFMFVKSTSKNTKIQKKDFNEMVVDVLEKSIKPLSAVEIKKIISSERGISDTSQIHQSGKVIPIRAYPKNLKMNKWALIDKHLNISKDQLIQIILEMQVLIKKNGSILTPEQCIEAIKGNKILDNFQDKILLLFALVDKNINFIEKNQILYHVDYEIPDLSQEDCLKVIASKIDTYGISKSDLLDKVQSLYGKNVPYNIPAKLYRYGFIFNETDKVFQKGEIVEY